MIRDRKFKFQVEEINNALIVAHSYHSDKIGENSFKWTELQGMFQLMTEILGVKKKVKVIVDGEQEKKERCS